MPISFTHTDLAPSRVAESLASSGFDIGPPVKVVRTVLDTFDGRLHRAGLRLELQEGGDRALVLTGAPGTPPARLAWPGPAPRLARDLPGGPFGSRVAAPIEERALLPVFDIASTSREARRRDRRGKSVVSVVVHDSLRSAAAPDAVLPAWVAEVVGVAGHPNDLERTTDDLAGAGFARHEADLVDLALAAAGRSLEGRSNTPTIALDPADDALDAYRAVLRNLLEAMVDNLPGTVADLDPEFLHELRVAIRRTRSVLGQGKGVLPDEVRDRYRTAFGDLGAATGRTRDLDVYVLGWSETVEALQLEDPAVTAPVLAELEARRRAAHVDLGRVLEGRATRQVLAEWETWLADPDVGDHGSGPIGPVAASHIAKAQATLLGHGRAIRLDSPAEQLHDLRKQAKKLRYLLECFGGLMPPKGRKAFVSQLKALQDNLGEHQDAEVLLNELRGLATDLHERGAVEASTLLATGRLIDGLDRRRQRARDEFVERFAAYDAKENRRTLDDLLEPLGRP